MRTWAGQFGIALLAVAFAPLAGFGPSARAGYLVTDGGFRSAVVGKGGPDLALGMSGAANSQESSDPRDRQQPNGNGPQSPSPSSRLSQAYHVLWMGLGQSGAGAGSIPTGPVSGGSALYAAVGARLLPMHAQLTGWLYIDELESRPPPFPSRLFRPPRF
jgi:hypothetical protein